MLGNPFGIKDSILKDKSKLKVIANIDGRDIHTADLFLVKPGFFSWSKPVYILQADLTEPTREIEAKIEKLETDLAKQKIKLEQTIQETMDFIRTVEPNVFDDRTIFSRWKSKLEKAKKEKDKENPKTRTSVVSLAQNNKQRDNNQNNKGNNGNNQKGR